MHTCIEDKNNTVAVKSLITASKIFYIHKGLIITAIIDCIISKLLIHSHFSCLIPVMSNWNGFGVLHKFRIRIGHYILMLFQAFPLLHALGRIIFVKLYQLISSGNNDVQTLAYCIMYAPPSSKRFPASLNHATFLWHSVYPNVSTI